MAFALTHVTITQSFWRPWNASTVSTSAGLFAKEKQARWKKAAHAKRTRLHGSVLQKLFSRFSFFTETGFTERKIPRSKVQHSVVLSTHYVVQPPPPSASATTLPPLAPVGSQSLAISPALQAWQPPTYFLSGNFT